MLGGAAESMGMVEGDVFLRQPENTMLDSVWHPVVNGDVAAVAIDSEWIKWGFLYVDRMLDISLH